MVELTVTQKKKDSKKSLKARDNERDPPDQCRLYV